MDIYAVGDIHGCAEQLDALLEALPIAEDDWVVFLGDYIDAGSDSKAVIDRLIKWRERHPRTIFLFGNHEVAFVQFIKDGDLVAYAKMSGIPTLKSYVPEPRSDLHQHILEAIPSAHVAFFKTLRRYWNPGDVLFSHAGSDPRNAADRGLENMTLKSHFNIFGDYRQAYGFVICGHYFSRRLTVRMTDNAMCIDTGCGILKGPLSGVSLRRKRVFQASAARVVSSEPLVFSERSKPIIKRLLDSGRRGEDVGQMLLGPIDLAALWPSG